MMHIPDPWRLALVLALSTCTSATAQEQPQPDEPTPVSRTIEIPDEPHGVDPTPFLPEALAKKATVDFDEVSLREVFQWLEQESGLSVEVDLRDLVKEGISTADLFSDHLTDQPLFLLLDRMSRLGIGWVVDDGVLYILSEENRDGILIAETYNLSTLLDAGFERESLLETVLHATAGPWEARDGVGGNAAWLGDVLFVRQSNSAHRQLQALFIGLMNHGRQTYVYDLPINQELRDLMNQEFEVAIDDMPLELAVRELAETVGADMRIDFETFKSEGVSPRESVSVHLKGHSLRTILRIMLNQKTFWAIKDGVIWITAGYADSEEMITAIYDVRDLSRDSAEEQALTGAIVDQTAGPWEESDGVGGIVLFPRHGTMVVMQNRDNHDQIGRVLDLFRKSLLASKPRPVKDKSGEIITRYYRMPLPMAEDVQRLLPLLVRPETWNGDQPGRVLLANSEPEIQVPNAPPPTGKPANAVTIAIDAVVTPQGVLVVRQTRSAHDEVAEFISHIRHGEIPAPTGSFGGGVGIGTSGAGFGPGEFGGNLGGGGGFVGGFFTVLDRTTVPDQE